MRAATAQKRTARVKLASVVSSAAIPITLIGMPRSTSLWPMSCGQLQQDALSCKPPSFMRGFMTYDNLTTNVTAIGRVTTGGAITLTPTLTANSLPTDITAGPDGAMWFTEAAQNVGRITTG